MVSNGNAPSRLANASTPPKSSEAADHQRDDRGELSAIGKAAGAPPQAAEIQDAEREPGAEMDGKTEQHGPGRRQIERGNAHALCIHFQADQHPSASPSMRRGAVQNSPELNF